jgi:hypothetical protein
MTQEETLKFVLYALGGVAVIGSFLYWHFKTVNGFKDDIHKLELKQKELEKRDDLQQLIIDQFKELFPILKDAFDHIKNQKQEKR